jgi:hypothetical protein
VERQRVREIERKEMRSTRFTRQKGYSKRESQDSGEINRMAKKRKIRTKK